MKPVRPLLSAVVSDLEKKLTQAFICSWASMIISVPFPLSWTHMHLPLIFFSKRLSFESNTALFLNNCTPFIQQRSATLVICLCLE
jgi:hypothetical protein